MIFRCIILSTLFLSTSVMASSFGCKDSSGKLYISKTPCSTQQDTSKSGHDYISKEDIKYLNLAQTSLNKKGLVNKNNYRQKNEVSNIKACFATDSAPHYKGNAISYKGFRFKCMLVKQPTVDVYAFYPIDLIRQCRYRPSNKECKVFDNNTQHQLFSQL